MRFFLHDSHFTMDRRLRLAGNLPALGEWKLWDRIPLIATRCRTYLIKFKANYDRINQVKLGVLHHDD
jgi:hypothetical protein